MNTANILAVADAIEQHTIPWLGFNMHNYKTVRSELESFEGIDIPDQTKHNCNTVACIAGWANAIRLNLTEKTPSAEGWSDEDAAGIWLGIYDAVSFFDEESSRHMQLFRAQNHPDYDERGSRMWKDIPADQAVRTLRHLAATGQVDWTV